MQTQYSNILRKVSSCDRNEKREKMYNYSPYFPINISESASSVTPRDVDILCGRGSTCFKHIGNQNFRFIVSVHLPKYTDPLTTRKEKGIIIQNIVNDLHDEGRRFLKEGLNGWFILSHKDAKYKVGHALRDAASEMKKYLKRHVKKTKSKGGMNSKNKDDSPATCDINTNSGKDEVLNTSNSLAPKKFHQKSVPLKVVLRQENELSEEFKTDTILSSISHLLSEQDDESIKDDDSLFDSIFDSLLPTLFDGDEDEQSSEKELTLMETLSFDDSLFPLQDLIT